MDALTVRRVVDVLRWLAVELQHEQHPLAHVPLQLAGLVRDGGPQKGCKGCGGPVQQCGRGRPRLHCESCRAPRTKVEPKGSIKP